MQNKEQTNTETQRMTKQEYNKRYYEKNKHRWNAKESKSAVGNVFDLFSRKVLKTIPSELRSGRYDSFFKNLEILILIGIVLVTTTFLIREAAKFYMDEHEGVGLAYFKAIIIEGLAVVLTVVRCDSRLVQWIKSVFAVSLCLFTIWVMSGKLVKTASSDTTRWELLNETLKQLNSEISQKEQLKRILVNNHQVTTARRYEKGLDEVRARRVKIQEELSAERPTHIITNDLRTLIVFRLFLALGNLICIHLVMVHFRHDTPQNREQNTIRRVEFS